MQVIHLANPCQQFFANPELYLFYQGHEMTAAISSFFFSPICVHRITLPYSCWYEEENTPERERQREKERMI